VTAPFPPWLEGAWSDFLATVREGRLGHALLVAGEAGLCKRMLVDRMLARLMCQSPRADDDHCGRCRGCHWRAAGTHPDVFRIGPEDDSDSIKVDQVRDLIGRVQLTAQAGSIRVVILDPADAMNASAQNALLKTLEEPASGVHIILVADVPSRLLATVRSRCRSLPVHAPGSDVAREWLSLTGVAVPADDIAALAAGHPGALAILAEEKRSRRAQAVADDLRGLADGDESALAVARRWSEDGSGHVDDAIAWLRVWTWDANRVRLVHAAAPAVSSVVFTDACLQAIRARDRLRGPLKTQWLLHEWLAAWQSATRAARA
jgi:DNA polymerase-3 subunit delta'